MSDAAGVEEGEGTLAESLVIVGQELRRRNGSAVAMDVLYLFTTAFLATLAIRGFWPAVIAALPLATFLYFAWHSSRPFFVTNLVVIAATAAATEAGLMPL
ncbi:hypothetical protein [Salinilacihabitans rarus]|uniref:hypothetical protein n=1 Tax=Salinilacihabitans rarus TaxID=2961596 RepID=UPI0020C84CD5|nr:hypothetical protein [Salinilacihabitans rarus]